MSDDRNSNAASGGTTKRRAFLIEFQGDMDTDVCTSDIATIIDLALDRYFEDVADLAEVPGCRVFETLDPKELDVCLGMIRDHSGIIIPEEDC